VVVLPDFCSALSQYGARHLPPWEETGPRTLSRSHTRG
jgi:hypothetical protein